MCVSLGRPEAKAPTYCKTPLSPIEELIPISLFTLTDRSLGLAKLHVGHSKGRKGTLRVGLRILVTRLL
jgi:hypothetical protein